MAFLCPSQLAMKKKFLQPSKKPLPPDVYVPSTNGAQTEIKRSSLKGQSPRNEGTKAEQRTVRIQDNYKEAGFRHESLVERKIKAATVAKPANIWVKILQDFDPSDNEELQVRKGQFVKVIYQQHDWVYVVDSLENEGFVPFSYCSILNASTDSISSTSGCDDSNEDGVVLEDSFEKLTIEKLDLKKEKRRHSKNRGSRARNKLKSSPVTYFPKRAYGPQMTVLYDYEAGDENDVCVSRGEFVMLLNDQDPDWLWVVTESGEEGFIPRTFVMAHTCEDCRKKLFSLTTVSSLSTVDNNSDVTATSSSSVGEKHSFTDYTSSNSSQDKKLVLKGTRLIVLYEYQASAFDDLSVRPGEYVYANLKDQIAPGWIWAYSPRKKRTGYIPQDYVKEPVVTEI